jgi:putative glutathione S-transferase
MRDCWKIEGVRATTKIDHIKTHYWTSHPKLNCYAVVPKGPGFLALLE